MSVKFKDSRGKYEVRWREGGRARSRLFDRKGDADAFDLDVRRRKQLGSLAPSVLQSKVTLAEFVEMEWWPRYAIPNLAPDTRRRYLEVWGSQLLPRVGGYALREITPMLIEDLRAQLEHQGLGAPTVRKAMLLLQGILKRAVMRGMIPMNPASMVDKPRQRATSTPQPLAPVMIERIREIMLEPRSRLVPASAPGQRPRRAYEAPAGSPLERQRNALVVSMLAYAGLRPIEDRGARWGDLGNRTLHVFATKTARARDVDLLAPLVQDLAEFRLACGRPDEDQLIVPRPSGGEWTRSDWANWRRRVWRPAAIAAGVTGDLRPYRLRGSFVSLLLWAGEDLVYVSEQAGHSVATLATHYAGVMSELKGQPRVPAVEAIRQARQEVHLGELCDHGATGLGD
jgi:integrase